MARLPSDQFVMGSPVGEPGRCDAEGPEHKVIAKGAIALGRFEVTRGEFERFVNATGYVTETQKGGGCWVYSSGELSKEATRNWREPGFDQDVTHPVVCVSWNDARAYAEWLSSETGERYRLPTEAEWEYGVRAGSNTAYWWGNTLGNNRANCSYCGSLWDYAGTAPVGSFPTNRLGLSDTAGNVMELVEDCWYDSYLNAPSDAHIAWGAPEGDH